MKLDAASPPRHILHSCCGGWPAERIPSEHFEPVRDGSVKPEPFEAWIASAGQVLQIPAEPSLLDALRGAGFGMLSSCELGVCGSCVCGYRDGTVIHRDVVLPLARRRSRMMPCVSRAQVAVTLDLCGIGRLNVRVIRSVPY